MIPLGQVFARVGGRSIAFALVIPLGFATLAWRFADLKKENGGGVSFGRHGFLMVDEWFEDETTIYKSLLDTKEDIYNKKGRETATCGQSRNKQTREQSREQTWMAEEIASADVL
jgi:hypothetical protein